MAKLENVSLGEIAERLVGLTVKEVSELSDILKDEYGIEPVMVASAGNSGPTPAADGSQEKTSFNVVIKNVGGQKLAIVKAVKEILGVGLKEAKDLVDAEGKPIKEGATKAEAEELKSKLTELGAEVELV